MVLHGLAMSTSPLPHQAEPPPLTRSPSSLLGLTESQKRRRKNMSRASSNEPTVAGGLSNWRRQPKLGGSGTGTGTTGSGGTSEKNKRKGALGMGMQGTPAKKGMRSNSKSMGVHSTPAVKIRSRSQSQSRPHGVQGKDVSAESSLSSLGSLPSSADMLTLSPQSLIPDLSSPSLPAITRTARKEDVFDSTYVLSPKERTSEELEDWDRLIQDAEAGEADQEFPEEEEVMEDEMGALYGWKEDVLWSVQGSVESATWSAPLQPGTSERNESVDDPTIRNGTIYHDILMSMNDNSQPSTSPSSRTKARSSTIRNRQPTPRKPSSSGTEPRTARRTSALTANIASDPPDEATFYTARTSRAPVDQSARCESISDEGEQAEDLVRPASARKQRHAISGADLFRLQHLATAGDTQHTMASRQPRSVPDERQRDQPLGNDFRPTLSQLLNASDPVKRNVRLSDLLKSTQSTGDPLTQQPKDYSLEYSRKQGPLPKDVSEIASAGAAGVTAELDLHYPFDDFSQPPEPDFHGASSDGHEALPLSPMPDSDVSTLRAWRFRGDPALLVPFAPSSQLSPRSPSPPLSHISFTASRSPSVQPPTSPLHPSRSPQKNRHSKRTRRGAWRGAEVLARMNAADRNSAKYHMAFDRVSVGSEVGDGDSLMEEVSTSRKRRVSVASVAEFEESEEVLEARKRRLEHYKELEEGYQLHVELVL